MSQPTSVILPGTGEQIESGLGARELCMPWILRRDGVARPFTLFWPPSFCVSCVSMWLPHALVCDNQGAAWWCSQCSSPSSWVCYLQAFRIHSQLFQHILYQTHWSFVWKIKQNSAFVLCCLFLFFFLIKARVKYGKFLYCNCWKDFRVFVYCRYFGVSWHSG